MVGETDMACAGRANRGAALLAKAASILLLLCSGLLLAGEGQWQPASPMPDKYDWIQLKSGEWLKGELIVLYNGRLEFDSTELDLLTLDFEDVVEIRSAQLMQVRLLGEEDLIGILLMADGQVRVSGTGQSFDRSRLLTVTAGEAKEINFWNARLSVGANWRQGNTEQAEGNASAMVQRRTLEGRMKLDYLGNYSTIDGSVSANSHRASGVLDKFITHRFFVRPVFVEYYRDPFQNIGNRLTVGTGVGYELLQTVKTEWTVFGGPAYQYTRFDQVEEGDAETESTPALVGGTQLEIELSPAIDFTYDYQLQLVSRAAGLYNHHMITGFTVELSRLLDFDISLVWDRVAQPKPDADGIEPEQDDWRLIIGLGFDF